MQHVQHRHRVGFRRIRADVDRRLGVLHVVVGVGHRTITPGVRHAGHRGGVADAGLVVGVVGAPEADPLAQQVGLFVVVLAGAHDEDGIGPAGGAQFLHLRGDLIERLLPADALVLAVHQLHRRAQPVLAVAVLAQGGALGAVRAQVDGAVEDRLLPHPHAVFHHRIHRAAHRAVAAHGAAHAHLGGAFCAGGAAGRLGLLDQGQLGSGHAGAHTQARAAQESPTVHRGNGARHATGQAGHQGGGRGTGGSGSAGQQHENSRCRRRRGRWGAQRPGGGPGRRRPGQTRAVW